MELYLPHINILLNAIGVPRERLNARGKAAIDTRILRLLLETIAGQMAFDGNAYIRNNPDVGRAHKLGEIDDLRKHYVETGFLEGRLAAEPEVDEAFYTENYQDIAPAIRRGDIASATDHYIRAGAAEGRATSAAQRVLAERWAKALSKS